MIESVVITKSTPVVVPIMAAATVVVTMFVYVVALMLFRCASACGSSYDEF